MHHFVTEMCTYVHISVTKWCIVGYELVHCGICEMGLLSHVHGIVIVIILLLFSNMTDENIIFTIAAWNT